MGNYWEWMLCCCPCWEFTDDFNRQNAPTPGGAWEVVAGTWPILNNELTETTGTGILVTVAEHPRDNPTGIVQHLFNNIQAGTTYAILIDYLDEDNYYYGSYFWDGGATADLTVGVVKGGLGEELASVEVTPVSEGEPPVYYETLRLCKPADGIYLGIASDYHTAWECEIEAGDMGGRKAGVKIDGPAETSYSDDFYWSEHYHTNHLCPTCFCDCEDHCVGTQLTMTFVVDECPCPLLDGRTDDSDVLDNASQKVYIFSLEMPWDIPTSASDCDLQGPFEFWLHCPEDAHSPCEDWYLEMNEPVWEDGHALSEHGWNEDNIAYPSTCTCDPFSLTFGPFRILTEEGWCEYTIVIT